MQIDNILSLGQIAEIVEGEIAGDPGLQITGAAAVTEAEPGDIVFAETAKFAELAQRSKASALLLSRDVAAPVTMPAIRVENARVAFVRLLSALQPPRSSTAGIHPTAVLGERLVLGSQVSIDAHTVIAADTHIGDNVSIGAGCYVGSGVTIGNATVIHPNVTLYDRVSIGAQCILHAGAVIGAEGFGYVPIGPELVHVPHLGTVRIEDRVEIGANTCIDRAKTGETVIDKGTKLDNLIHIAHNVHIGKSCLVVAQVGIAGSVTIGDGVVLAGQAGIADHLEIGSGARVAAQGGVIGDILPGITVSGYPARPHREKMREHAAAAHLPEYIKRIRALERRLAELETILNPQDGGAQ